MFEKLGERLYGAMQKIGKKLPQTDSVALQGVMYGSLLALVLVVLLMLMGGFASCGASLSSGGQSAGRDGYIADGDDVPQGVGRLTAVEQGHVETATVITVLDGDTLGVELADGTRQRVRLIGVDTPESVHPDESRNTEEGIRASEHTKSIVEEGSTIYMTGDVSREDRYGRLLRYVWFDDPSVSELEPSEYMLNAVLVKDGYAKAVDFEPDTKYSELFHALEDGTYVPERTSDDAQERPSSSSSNASASASDAVSSDEQGVSSDGSVSSSDGDVGDADSDGSGQRLPGGGRLE